MFEKSLHGGSIAIAFASVATAADLTFTGGAGTAISAALSGVAIFKSAKPEEKALAKRMLPVAQTYFDTAHLTPDRKKVIAQMLALFPPAEEDLAKGSMQAHTIATNMRKHTAEQAKGTAHTTPVALDDYETALREILNPFVTPETQPDANLKELLIRTDKLMEHAEKTGDVDRMRDEGITEKAIIRLAQRIARETGDLGQAWLELQNAMDIAVRVQAEGRVPSNHGDFVDEVLKRVAELSADGEYAKAGDEIDEALAKIEAEQSRLLQSGIENAMLAGDSARSNGCTTWSEAQTDEILKLVEGNPTTLYIYPEGKDINTVARAVQKGQPLGEAYWNASCLSEIGAPRFWSKRELQPIINKWRRSLPKQPQRVLPVCE